MNCDWLDNPQAHPFPVSLSSRWPLPTDLFFFKPTRVRRSIVFPVFIASPSLTFPHFPSLPLTSPHFPSLPLTSLTCPSPPIPFIFVSFTWIESTSNFSSYSLFPFFPPYFPYRVRFLLVLNHVHNCGIFFFLYLIYFFLNVKNK